MPSQYWGEPSVLDATLPTPKNIASSTNATPIAVTTSAPHGMKTGDSVFIRGHTVNTAANGSWRIVVTSTTAFTLVGSVGNGVGGATGTSHLQGFGSGYLLPSALDGLNVASVNVALEALGDRTAELFRIIGWQQVIYKGGTTTVIGTVTFDSTGGKALWENGSLAEWGSGSNSLWLAGSIETHEGASTWDGSSSSTWTSGADVTWESGANISLQAEFKVAATGSIVVKDHGGGTSGFIKVETNGLLRVDGVSNIFGTETIQSGGQFTLAAGSEADFNGEIARTGPLLITGNNACTGIRWVKFDGNDGRPDGDGPLDIYAHAYDRIGIPTLTGNHVWFLLTPADPFLAGCAHMVTIYRGSNTDHDLEIRDKDSNDLLGTFTDGDFANGFASFLWDPADNQWKTVGATPP